MITQGSKQLNAEIPHFQKYRGEWWEILFIFTNLGVYTKVSLTLDFYCIASMLRLLFANDKYGNTVLSV